MLGFDSVLIPKYVSIPDTVHHIDLHNIRTANALCILSVLTIAIAGIATLFWRGTKEALIVLISSHVYFGLRVVKILSQSYPMFGERYWWLGDDSMISMRFARNLVDGHGLVWNPHEYIEGYTNFLWTMVMALLHYLPLSDAKMPLAVGVVTIVLGFLLIPLLLRFLNLFDASNAIRFVVLIAYASNAHFLHWTWEANEVTLLCVLTLWVVCRIVEESRKNAPQMGTYCILSLLAVLRADAIVLSGMLCALAILLHRDRVKIIRYGLIVLVLPALHLVFRVWYYSDILPNTAYLKAFNFSNRYMSGALYLSDFTLSYSLILILVVFLLCLRYSKEVVVLLSVFLLYSIYLLYIGGDAFWGFRFILPMLPVLISFGFLAFDRIENPQFSAPRKLVVTLLLVTILPNPLNAFPAPYYIDPISAGNVQIGVLLKEQTPESTRVGDVYAGSVFYFSHRYGIDFLGKSDRYIARLPETPGALIPGHNKFDYEYSFVTQRPDYVIGPFPSDVSELIIQANTEGSHSYLGRFYTNAVFVEHCKANRLQVDTWRPIYRCLW